MLSSIRATATSDNGKRRQWIAKPFHKDGHYWKEGRRYQINLESDGLRDQKVIPQD